MLKWLDVIKYANYGSPDPQRRVEKTDDEWRQQLTHEQFRITRLKGTESAFSGAHCELHQPGLYACVCCDTLLFDSRVKFGSGSGWPSFTQPIKPNAIKYEKDGSHGMSRIEVMCNTCDAHQGHVFPDGPEPSGLRYCINSASLIYFEKEPEKIAKATFGNGCFWCTEAVFQNLGGVLEVESGYSGGNVSDPGYREVCSGTTGHAEVVQITFDSEIISYQDLLRVFFASHNPTSLNRQGADEGTQYRSVVFYHDEQQLFEAEQVAEQAQALLDDAVVTEISPLTQFYAAEHEHKNYYQDNSSAPYCQAVISPKLQKLKASFGHLIAA